MSNLADTRRRFMAHFAGIGLGSTLVPGVVWARMQDQGTQRVTAAMVKEALRLQGVDVPDADVQAMVAGANQSLTRYEDVRKMHIPLDVSPPFHFSALAPGIEPNRTQLPFRMSAAPAREAAVEPRGRRVLAGAASGRARAHEAGEIASSSPRCISRDSTSTTRSSTSSSRSSTIWRWRRRSRRTPRSPPASTRDRCTAFRGARRTSSPSRATRRPGARRRSRDRSSTTTRVSSSSCAMRARCSLAKVTTGELAQGDMWFGGRTNSPWDPAQGSSGSSAGSSSATAAGCVAFAIGSETSGSILSPAARCGIPSLRPTFGRISRYGVMALSWTQDRLGPMVRYAEDAALVMQAIAKLDGRDMSVSDIPFNWDARLDIKKLRVGYIKESFDELTNADAKANATKMLDTLRSPRRHELHRDEDSDVADERQQPRRRVVRVLRRDAARGQAHRVAHGQRRTGRPRGCCRPLSTCSSSGCA